MNDIDWVVRQNVGIFFKTREWKDKVYTYILEHAIPASISRTYNCKDEALIIFKNGSSIRFVPATSTARGHKFTRIGYEQGISDEIITVIIEPALFNRVIEMEI